MNEGPFIIRGPAICGGELADGERFETILREFPTFTLPNLHAVIRFAAASTDTPRGMRQDGPS